jgi:hypothetical protein
MRVLCLLLSAAAVVAQVVPRNQGAIAQIGIDLMKLTGRANDSMRQALVSHIMAAAEKAHAPSRAAVAEFVAGLADALSGRRIGPNDAAQLANAIYDVLHSARERAFPLEDNLWRAERVLVAANVSQLKVRSITENLTAIGTQVRGPQDAPTQ